jgi:hypothetical protein
VAARASGETEIVRDFLDPRLELVRLLHAAGEIEHALLVQYLYAALSVKPAYRQVAGSVAGRPTHLFGVAIQEMRHLQTVNGLLGALGAAPSLVVPEFPYEPAIYPFPLHLEPLSRASLAKYVYTEAPAGAVARDGPDRPFLDLLYANLGDVRPNHIGSLYATVIAVLRDFGAQPGSAVPDLEGWARRLQEVKDEGEQAHFELFKQVFMGTHPGFGGVAVWDLPPEHPDYPALPLPVDPSAYEGHPQEIKDKTARRVAWLGDLQYWIVLMLLDLADRPPRQPSYLTLAVEHMAGPLLELGRHLPVLGTGMPFDPLSMGYSPGLGRDDTVDLLRRMLSEAQRRATELQDVLPDGYSGATDATTLDELQRLEAADPG